MGKEIITSVNIEVEKHKFYQCKNPISIYDVNVDRIVVYKKVFFKKGFKYFDVYENDDEKVMLLHIMLPKMSAYRKKIDETKYMSFLIKDIIKKALDSVPV